MHMLIRGLVDADDPDEALAAAKAGVFDRLVRDDIFDYYVTADMEGRGVSGTDRWGDYPLAVPADSDVGETLVETGWQSTVNEYESAFDRVDEFLETCDRCDIWEDEHTHREYQYAFHRIGQFTGNSTFLYDEYGHGIRDRGHLDRVLSGDVTASGANNEEQPVYVVPADVHY